MYARRGWEIPSMPKRDWRVESYHITNKTRIISWKQPLENGCQKLSIMTLVPHSNMDATKPIWSNRSITIFGWPAFLHITFITSPCCLGTKPLSQKKCGTSSHSHWYPRIIPVRNWFWKNPHINKSRDDLPTWYVSKLDTPNPLKDKVGHHFPI